MNIDSNRSHVNGRWDPRLLSAVVAAMLWLVAPVPVPAAPAPDDPYVAGYAGAVLERTNELLYPEIPAKMFVGNTCCAVLNFVAMSL